MGKSLQLTQEQNEFIVYQYTILKKGVNAIGRELGISGVTVQRHLKKLGVRIRNLQEGMQECRTSNVNDNYFKTQSHNMAYILGFLAADGCVSKDTNHFYIDLQESDEEILYKIKNELSFAGDIQHYTNNHGCTYSRLRVCSKTIKEDLSHYGITPKKTYTLNPPHFLEKQYYISYIRGYFDGDGCIYIKPEKYAYNWYICGARKNVLTWIQDILLNEYGIISYLRTKKEKLTYGDSFYYLQVYKKTVINQIFNVLYIEDSLFLDRKYQIMKQTFVK